MSLSLSVFSQSGPPKSVGGGGRGVGGGGGRIPHFNWSIYRGGNFFFFFFFVSGLKLDEKSIENGLEGQKFLVVCLFWGGCHHPNTARLQLSLKLLYYILSKFQKKENTVASLNSVYDISIHYNLALAHDLRSA